MSLDRLINPNSAKSAAHLSETSSGSSGGTHFTYLLWDMQPEESWLSAAHPFRSALPSAHWRPLYLGKAAGWSSVKRHLVKDGLGCGARLPT